MITIIPQVQPEAVETPDGIFLVAPDGKVLERLFTSDDEEAFHDWLSDLRRDDEVAFETRCGEGWTTAHWRQKWIEDGWWD